MYIGYKGDYSTKEHYMILRSWHGIVPIEKAESFKRHLLATGVADVKAISGNL
jgi:hypothetical protein